jgi:hypothetical protein
MNNELIIYQTEDGQTQVNLKAIDGTVWLTQKEIATLFDRNVRTINEHLKTLFADNELQENSVIRNFRITATDGKSYDAAHYNLDAILAVGYRVRSARGIQFRKWATTILKEYLIKGFAMDDARLKQATQWDYFDEWLARIREIRASEKRFYQKIKDLYITAIDYNKDDDQAKLFFKKVQNKMLWAVTGHTAAEIIADRSNPELTNMGLTSWTGSKVRKMDVDTAKNYLSQQEVDELNRIVTMYLDYAEDQAKKRKAITMAEWEQKVDAFLSFNERELLTHAGTIRASVAKQLAEERYALFDKHRQTQELEQANEDDIAELEQIAKQINRGDKGLYGGLDAKGIHKNKGLQKSQKILDHMNSTELAANLFRATQTEEKLKRDEIQNKVQANQTHYEVGKKVRETIQELGGTMPEDLPTVEDIQKLERKAKSSEKKLTTKTPLSKKIKV